MMTDMPEEDDSPASEALQEARARKSAKSNRNKWVAGAVATGIGSAALAGALIYANRAKRKGD
jgi:hypothetical protein